MENKPKIKHFKIKLFSIITALLVCVIGISFAYFVLTAPTNTGSVKVSSGRLSINYSTIATIAASHAELNEESVNEFTVTNNSPGTITFDIYLTNISSSKLNNSDDFKWELYNGDTNKIGNGTGKTFSNTSSDVKLNTSAQTLNSNASATFKFKVKIENTSSDQSGLYEGTFNGQIKIVAQNKR